jgi:hypothetical protein
MKKRSVLLFALLPIVAAAANSPSLAFPDQKIGLPPLSLGEIAASAPRGEMGNLRAWFRSKAPSAVSAKKYASNMPILVPRADIDPAMVKAPDSTTDYKLIVKAPNVESTR